MEDEQIVLGDTPIEDELVDNEGETPVDNDEQNPEDNANEDEEFDPDKMFEDDVDQYNVAGYDLSKYKDVLNFEDESVVEEFSQYIQKYSDKGFTQEQIEFILDDRLSDVDEKPKRPSMKDIQARLSQELSREERRNYRAVNAFVSGALNDTDLAGREKEIMQNPALVKLMNIIYKKSLGSTTNLKSTQKPKEGQLKSMSYDDASDRLLKAIENGEADSKLINNLKSQVVDREAFDELLEALGK